MKAKLLAILMAVAMVSGPAFADEVDSACAHVFVNILPTVAVSAPVDVLLDAIQATQCLRASLVFQVEANLQTIDMFVTVSNLYKGDDPASEYFIPVKPGHDDKDVKVQPANGSETFAGGGDNWLAYTDTPTTLKGYAALETEIGTFESGQSGHFSQDVTVSVSWTQDNPELPVGEYSGWVMLTAMVPPTPGV
jgi:hypothetical protein